MKLIFLLHLVKCFLKLVKVYVEWLQEKISLSYIISKFGSKFEINEFYIFIYDKIATARKKYTFFSFQR